MDFGQWFSVCLFFLACCQGATGSPNFYASAQMVLLATDNAESDLQEIDRIVRSSGFLPVAIADPNRIYNFPSLGHAKINLYYQLSQQRKIDVAVGRILEQDTLVIRLSDTSNKGEIRLSELGCRVFLDLQNRLALEFGSDRTNFEARPCEIGGVVRGTLSGSSQSPSLTGGGQ